MMSDSEDRKELGKQAEDIELDDFEEEYETVSLIDEDGTEIEYLIVDAVEHEGTTYYLMVESKDADSETADALIFKEVETDGEFIYEAIEDDAEFDTIAALFESDNDDYTLEV